MTERYLEARMAALVLLSVTPTDRALEGWMPLPMPAADAGWAVRYVRD